jgi:hypothetical protein
VSLFQIRFQIERNFEVHGKDQPSPAGASGDAPLPVSPLRRAVAEAVALHFRAEGTVAPLDVTGGWVDIPLLSPHPGEIKCGVPQLSSG